MCGDGHASMITCAGECGQNLWIATQFEELTKKDDVILRAFRPEGSYGSSESAVTLQGDPAPAGEKPAFVRSFTAEAVQDDRSYRRFKQGTNP